MTADGDLFWIFWNYDGGLSGCKIGLKGLTSNRLTVRVGRVQAVLPAGLLHVPATATLKGGTEIEIDLTMYGVGAPGDYSLEPGTFAGTCTVSTTGSTRSSAR